MLRLHNRIMDMNPERLPKLVYQYDMQQKKSQWYHEIGEIAKAFHLPSPSLCLKYDMEAVSAAALHYSQNLWWEAAKSKPKLRTYTDFTEINDPRTLIKANLPRGQRSLLAKLMCGILPLEIEVGRFVGKDANKRFCTVCNELKIEDEYHFLYHCKKLKPTRKPLLKEFIDDYKSFKKLDDGVKTHIIMEADNIKHTGAFLEQMFRKRRDIVYNVNIT